MKPFMDKDFLLSTPTARTLFHDYAAAMPIIDYHCHVSPQEIFEDKRFDNIAQVWLAGDHYKWRLMRSNGVEERFITGDAPDREKFQKFAEALPRAIGNPMYHWCHLELKTYFGYEGVLNGDTAEEVWQLTAERLKNENMGVRGLIAQSNVAFIGTTDDPVDSLEWHKKLAADTTMSATVAPSFRPDKALNIDKAGWLAYITRLSEVSGVAIDGIDALETALIRRIEHFAAHGCRASDHGLDFAVFRLQDRRTVDAVVKKGLRGEAVTADEAAALKTALLLCCAAEYTRRGWVMQIHYNCLRNPNSAMFRQLGPDTGFDCIGPLGGANALALLLDAMHTQNALPRTILYSLDGGDNAFLDSLIGSFQGSEIRGKLQHGSAWWFNDTKQGMIDQLTSLANLSILGNFVGMLTDSRSFLSYTRHEYFRRILCELIGGLVENGEYPADMPTLGGLVQDICYRNAERYFEVRRK
ncbi:MAG: glucuronate isomerase [Ruminococcaceae bacterium]|nr:glucuronate isomerase [Oscillospiraceae bacterium]